MATIQYAEQWLSTFASRANPTFEGAGYPLPLDNLRIRIGLPTGGWRSNKLAEYFPPEQSGDGSHEIYVSPKVNEGDARIADILTAFLCHAAIGTADTSADVWNLCKAVGLDGEKSTKKSPRPSPRWFSWAQPIILDLGPMDFAALSTDFKPAQVKKTYLFKLECPDCGWLAQATKGHVHPHAALDCPVPDCD